MMGSIMGQFNLPNSIFGSFLGFIDRTMFGSVSPFPNSFAIAIGFPVPYIL